MQTEAARLYYLIGPSGAGKDSLLTALDRDSASENGLRIPRRYITRALLPGDEHHIELSADEFERRERAGDFLFAWHSHGFSYGIGMRVLDWLEAGDDVVVNGSRAYLDQALVICPRLVPVWITASEALLGERLGGRGRETRAQIDARIRRNRELEKHFRSCYSCIRNDNAIADAVAQFEALRRGGR